MISKVFDEAVEKVGGKFKLTVILQKRVRELVRGLQPLVQVESKASPIDIALKEIMEDKIGFNGETIDFKQLKVGKAEEKKEDKPKGKEEKKVSKQKGKGKKKNK